jgi:hypothetical protein
MPPTDFSLYYKRELPLHGPWPASNSWDIFVSAFNSSERVRHVYDLAVAGAKHWVVFPEYAYEASELPSDEVHFSHPSREESDFVLAFVRSLGSSLESKSICIDITGFMRPHLMFLAAMLKHLGIRKFDVIYSEPGQYKDKENTKFSDGPVKRVRPVNGFEGSLNSATTNDVLILGVGYDHELLKQVAEYKDYATIVPLFGFPSLRPDMYQESILRASKAGDIVFSRNWEHNHHFAPASDPFAAATALQEILAIQRMKSPPTNVFLSPLATKPQALGFALYFLMEDHLEPMSILFPFSERYQRETSKGIARIWMFTIEL